MHARTMRLGLSAASLAAMLAVLAGCSLLNTPKPTNTTAANDAAAAKFVACLIAEGQTAKILNGGQVGMLLPDGALEDIPSSGGNQSTDGGGAPMGMTSVIKDDEGEWQASSDAAGYPEDGGMRDAWTACETEVPEFTQPQPQHGDTTSSADQVKAALAFAKCARENGYADFPDPTDEGSMNLPSDITEDGFRALLEDCFDPDAGVGFGIQKETADKLDFDLMAVMDDFFADHPEYLKGHGNGPETSESGAK
jgi:hypothetical protein